VTLFPMRMGTLGSQCEWGFEVSSLEICSKAWNLRHHLIIVSLSKEIPKFAPDSISTICQVMNKVNLKKSTKNGQSRNSCRVKVGGY